MKSGTGLKVNEGGGKPALSTARTKEERTIHEKSSVSDRLKRPQELAYRTRGSRVQRVGAIIFGKDTGKKGATASAPDFAHISGLR